MTTHKKGGKRGPPSYLPQREKGFTFIHAFLGATCVGKTGVLDDWIVLPQWIF